MKFETGNWQQAGGSRVKPGSRSTMAFTLIELMVVFGMLAILMGAAMTGIGQARSQARKAKANVELRELMNAWLSYEAAYDDWPVQMEGDDLVATADNLKELLGDNPDKAVYLNAQTASGAFVDPWGTPYHFRLITKSDTSTDVKETFTASVTFPNRHRYMR
ncbi:MAG: type II secretion system protein [bacterium]